MNTKFLLLPKAAISEHHPRVIYRFNDTLDIYALKRLAKLSNTVHRRPAAKCAWI